MKMINCTKNVEFFGIYNHQDSAALTALGLHALQHRGQEAAGVVTFDGTKFISERHPD